MRCCAGERCLFPNLPLEGRHFCAICKKELHGICGIFNGDELALTFNLPDDVYICHFNSDTKLGQKEIEDTTFCKVALWTQKR